MLRNWIFYPKLYFLKTFLMKKANKNIKKKIILVSKIAILKVKEEDLRPLDAPRGTVGKQARGEEGGGETAGAHEGKRERKREAERERPLLILSECDDGQR